MRKKILKAVLALAVMVLIVVASSALTASLYSVSANQIGKGERVTVSQEQYELIKKYERLDDIIQIIEKYYYTDVDEDVMITGALRGALDSLADPYTFYYTPEEMAENTEHQEGEYEGVGIQVLGTADGEMIVTRTFKGSSAYEEGVRAGDRISAVCGTPVSAVTVQAMNEAVELIRGTVGTTVTVTVIRDGTALDFELERRKINMNRVEYMMLDGDIGYLMLYEFMGDAAEGFRNAVEDLRKNGAKGLILDVRSNPGGALDLVVDICDVLLPESTIMYMEDRAGSRDTYYSDSEMLGLPLVVLVNEMSASASEVLAGAVQDTGVGKIVGQTTFGKGVVQVIIPFMSDGAGMQLTIARYYTPSGRCIHGIGVEPDVFVEAGDFDFTISPVDPENDLQLKKAIEVIREEIGS